jgi:hypothetical protein
MMVPHDTNHKGLKWQASDRKYIGQRKPDIILVPKEVNDNVKWGDIVSTVEIKYKQSNDLLNDAILQLADTAALVLHHQINRQWFPCMSLLGTNLRMHVFTRGGSLHTEPLDIEKNVSLFTKVLNYFTEERGKMHGYDESFTLGRDSVTTLWWPGSEKGLQKPYELIGKLFLSTGAYPPHIKYCVHLTELDC